MKMRKIVLVLNVVLVFVSACNSGNTENELITTDTIIDKEATKTEVKKKPLTVDSLQKVIDGHEHLFLSYWGGMSQYEETLVTDYLLQDKESGLFVKTDKGRFTYWNLNLKNRTYELWLIPMFYDCSDHPNKLHFIRLEYFCNEENHFRPFVKDDFDELIKLYTTKYGKPKFTSNAARKAKTKDLSEKLSFDEEYEFRKNNSLVSVSYNLDKSSTLQLSIMYSYLPLSEPDNKASEKTRKEDLNNKTDKTLKQL